MRRMTRLEELRELRRLVCYGQANFDRIHSLPEDPLPTKESEVTEFIRRRTKLHLTTLVLPIMDHLIGRAEREVQQRRKRLRS